MAPSGPGIDVVDVWAFPSGGGAIFLGTAQYGSERPDVAAVFGTNDALRSAFSLNAPALAPGTYQVAAYARSVVTGRFDQVASRTVIVGGASRDRR